MPIKPPRPGIAFDMDDTMNHFMRAALAQVKHHLDLVLVEEQLTNTMWLHDLLTKEQLKQVLPYIFNQKFYAALEPTDLIRRGRASKEWEYLKRGV